MAVLLPALCMLLFCSMLLLAQAAETDYRPQLRAKLLKLLGSPLLNDPDLCAEIEPIITRKGNGFERHNVTTEDGYIIQMHRIPTGRVPCSNHSKPVVFLVAGLIQDSIAYVLDFSSQSAGFFMADKCYDVWIGNFRGTTLYGRKHVNSSFERSREFWDFTFNEFGVYDMPAQIDYILNNTGRDSLFHVALSQGCASFLVMMSERPEYNKKVRAVTFLAPMYNLAHVRLLTLSATLTVAKPALIALYDAGVRELLPKFNPISVLAADLCPDPASVICAAGFELALNFESKHVNKTRLPVYVCQYPTGTSTLNMIHTDQVFKAKRFQTFDPTFIKPPSFPNRPPRPYYVNNTNVDVGIIYSVSDAIVTVPDVKSLIAALGKNVKFTHLIKDAHFGHFNYATAAYTEEEFVLTPLHDFFSRYIN